MRKKSIHEEAHKNEQLSKMITRHSEESDKRETCNHALLFTNADSFFATRDARITV